MRQQLADLEREIYANEQEDDADLADILDDVATRVSGAADAVAAVGDKIEEASTAAIAAHKSNAEGMAKIMGQMARMMDDGQERVASAVEKLDQAKLLEAISTMQAEQVKATKTLATMLKATIALGERISSVEAAICAPKIIIKDKDGRPVGVRMGTDQ